jgi:hypothetical protein
VSIHYQWKNLYEIGYCINKYTKDLENVIFLKNSLEKINKFRMLI